MNIIDELNQLRNDYMKRHEDDTINWMLTGIRGETNFTCDEHRKFYHRIIELEKENSELKLRIKGLG